MLIKKRNKNVKKNIEETLIQVGLRIAKRGEGALFVVGNVKNRPLIKQTVPPFNIVDNPKLLESLALIDGAVVIDKNGMMRAYGAMIESKRILRNFGTRHSAAISASINNNLVVLVSEEDRKVKILRDRKMIMQIDSLQKNVEKLVPKAVEILELIGAGAIGTIGTSIIAPTLGIALLPGILVFGSAYYIMKTLAKKFLK